MITSVRTSSFVLALLLHAIALILAILLRLPDPASQRKSVELRFRLEREREATPLAPDRMSERPHGEMREAQGVRARRDVPPLSATEPRERSREDGAVVRLPLAPEPADSSRRKRVMEIRSVLDRKVDPEKAWEVLGELLEQYPQFRESVMREMIAGAGLPPDSLPRVDLHLDRMFRNGIPPSWGRQREAIEHAFRSFDPVMGWTNKGGYGPQINVIGLLKFLIDLIEGK